LKLDSNHFEEDDYFEKHQKYHQKYPESFGTIPKAKDQFSRPCYYGNVCLRMIAIVDFFCRRLIELREYEFLKNILDVYCDLFAYHECLITFIKDTMLYYYKILNHDIRLKLFILMSKY